MAHASTNIHKPMLGTNPPQNRRGECRVDWPFGEVDGGFEGYVGYVNGFTHLLCARALEKMDR